MVHWPLTSKKSVQYKFAPALIMLAPRETVDAWTSTGLNLNPRQLMPALMRYSSERRPRFAPYPIFEFCDQVLILVFNEVYLFKQYESSTENYLAINMSFFDRKFFLEAETNPMKLFDILNIALSVN